MRMPFRQQEPMSRVERARCAVQGRASDAAQTLSGAAHTLSGAATVAAGAAQGAARGAAASAAGRTQDAASMMAGRANLAAHGVADRATFAASTMAGRTRPLAAEAAHRCRAAWHVLRYGTPPGPMARVASALPVAAVTTAARRGKAPTALMVLGAAGAVGILAWRRSHADRENVWILEDDSDVEPVGRWPEGDSHAGAPDDFAEPGEHREHDERGNRRGRSGRGRDAKHAKGGMDAQDSMDGTNAEQSLDMDMDSPSGNAGPATDRKDSRANRWP